MLLAGNEDASPDSPFATPYGFGTAYEQGVLFKVNPPMPAPSAPGARTKALKRSRSQKSSIALDEPMLAYWVVGRLFVPMAEDDLEASMISADNDAPMEPRELYACFRDGTAQSMVEMAFKFQFGSPL